MSATKVQDFLGSYLEEYLSSASEIADAPKTPIVSPLQIDRAFNLLSEFKPRIGSGASSAFEKFAELSNNPEAVVQKQIARNSPGFVNAMSMFGG